MKRFGNALVIALLAGTLAVPVSAAPATASARPMVKPAGHSASVLTAASRPQREVLGFVNAGNLGNSSVGYRTWNFSLLSTVVYFALHVNSGDGALVQNDTDWNIYHSPTMSSFVQAAHAAGTKVLVSLNLHDFSTSPTNYVCQGLDPVNAGHTIGEIAAQVSYANIDGINIDYEGQLTTCANGQTNRAELVSFAQRMRAQVPGVELLIDTYSGSAEDNLEFFDIPGLQPYVDAFFVMAYDMDMDPDQWRSPPLNCTSFCFSPISPLNGYRFNVTKSMSQYMAYMHSSQIILGQPLYGRKGCVPALNVAHQNTTNPNYPYFVSPTYQYESTASTDPGITSFSAHRDSTDGVSEWDTWWEPSYSCNREQYWDDVVSLGAKYDLANRDDLRGVGFFTLDYAGPAPEFWNGLAIHFSLIPGLPGNLSACAGTTSAAISWTAAPTAGGAITSYQVTASPGGATVTVPGSATFATISGLTPGTPYTFTVQGINSSGPGVGAGTGTVTPIASPPVATSYFNWYDKASAGMAVDNIHILNPGTSASAGCVTVTGKAVAAWNINAGGETYLTFPAGTIGGPVVVSVNSGPVALASERVHFNLSFSEIWAQSPTQAATTSYFNWFDNASYGMFSDNVHVLNPGATAADVTVSVPRVAPLRLTVAPGGEAWATFPMGTIGGPVTVSSTQPVLASQRVAFMSSFHELWAMAATQAVTTSYFNWYDYASYAMFADNIHVLNPGTTVANVTVSLPGASPLKFSVGPGGETYTSFPAGTIGGPATISSTQPVLTSQRVGYYFAFSELWAGAAAQAATTSHFNWYDMASYGMLSDNIHVLNPGATAANVTVSLPGASPLMLTVAPGGEGWVRFPLGTIGGPVTLTATQPVLASQRVAFQQAFNEILAG